LSKEIAQTVGGKKVAWLIAIVAAMAVLATLGTQWRGASADTTGFTTTVSGGFAGPTAQVGNTATYTITIAPSGTPAPSLGSVAFVVELGPSIGNITSIDTSGFNGAINNHCSVSSIGGGTNNRIDCTYSPFVTQGAAGTITFNATALAPAILGAGGQVGTCGAVDNGDADSFTACTDSTLAVTIESAILALSKVDSVDPVTPGNNLTYTITATNTGPVAATATITDTLPSAAFASIVSATTTSGACSVSSLTVTCSNVSLVATTGTATVTIVATTKANPGIPSFSNTANLTSVVNGITGPTAGDSEGTFFVNSTINDMVHLDAFGNSLGSLRDVDNNVIGYRHTVCALNTVADAVWPNVLAGVGNNFKITTISGTATIEAPIVTSGVDCDFDGFFDDSTVSWYSVGTGEQNIIVVNDAGSTVLDADGTANGFNTPLVKEWNTLAPTWITSSSTSPVVQAGTGTPPSTADALSGTNLDGATVSGGMVFNPSTGVYQGSSSTYYEYPIATHANAAGTQLYIANGATVTITRASSSTCGAIVIDAVDGVDVDYVSGPTVLDQTSDTYVATSVGKGIPFHFESDGGSVGNCTTTAGMTKVNIQVSYPILLGSNQPPVPALETLTINWSATIAQKQVFLAWAGQRIILEHDWRIAAGDVDGGTDDSDPDPVGECPFGDRLTVEQNAEAQSMGSFRVQYIKGSGPGNFLQGLGAAISGSDQAEVDVTYDNEQEDSDIPGDPQDSCISRVLFESEDQGQVDIEAFVDDDSFTNINVTKHAFVIYYMKINTVNVSLVTQVSKPTHNGSLSTFGGTSTADWAPSNPWDASKDDADNTAEWNVSKDILVRGRVTGWFVNSNPSGRAADTSNPLNVLPANRWVMPNDWPLLAGGPDGDEAYGTAEEFRPYYDLMIAPNNAGGLALANPDNLGRTQVGSVATGNTGVGSTTSPVLVNSCAALSDGLNVTFGTSTTVRTVGTPGCVDNKLVLTAASQFAAGTAPAAGTAIFAASGVPFEGPYSLIDIPGLSLNGFGSAALSDWDPNNVRDTIYMDGDVDWWDAPMPPALTSVKLRGTGFLKPVYKFDVYYNGTANTASVANAGTQTFPNPYYIQDIPDSPFIPSTVVGGGYLWDTCSNDGPGGLGDGSYMFWEWVRAGVNSQGIGESLTAADKAELTLISTITGTTAVRDAVVYSDNHGEFMFAANGDFKTDLTACATNALAGGKHCAPGDKVGTGSISATADYPDFRGKHFPVLSNVATVDWTWGGYKDVTVEDGETDQYKYVVFHGMDRDGFCSIPTGAVSLHSVLSSVDDDYALNVGSTTRHNGDPVEAIDFLIDSGEGIIVDTSAGATTGVNDGKQFATGVPTFSLALNSTIKEFPLSPLAAEGQTDECQAWIKVSNSLLGVVNVLAIAHDDEGNIGFDNVIDLANTTSFTLNFRWSLITWAGADDIAVMDALKGTGTSGKNPGGNDISSSVTAIYGWNAATQEWLAFFPSGVNVPGANDLVSLNAGDAYWIAITGPSSVTWTIATNIN